MDFHPHQQTLSNCKSEEGEVHQTLLVYNFKQVCSVSKTTLYETELQSRKNMYSPILFFCLVVGLFVSSCRSPASIQNLTASIEPTPTFTSIPKNISKIPNDLIQQLITDINNNENNFRLSEEDLEILSKHLKYELYDLNDDEVSEFFLFIEHSDWCGAGSNCSYWVYRKSETGYKLLVEAKVLIVKDTVTNGYRDLWSETPMGFCERNVQRLNITPYLYDGEKYQAQKPITECRAYKPKQN